MDLSNNNDAVSVVKHLKEKMVVAFAFIMIKHAKREGVSAFNYTKSYQEKYITENQSKLDPILEQRFLRHRQDEVLEKLRKSFMKPAVLPEVMNSCEDNTLLGGSSWSWWDECSDTPQLERREGISMSQPEWHRELKAVFSAEESAWKNLQFVESMMRLSEESESTNTVSVSELHTLLYDEAENNISQLRGSSVNVHSEKWSMGTSEESTCNVNFVSSGAVRFALQSTNTMPLILYSVRSVVNFVKIEIETRPKEVFNNWRGSVIESACEFLNKYAEKSDDCREMLLDLVTEMIEGVWSDERLAQQELWEKKMFIVNDMLKNSENCYKVFQSIADKVNYFTQCLMKKEENLPLMSEKLYLLLDLHLNICENIKVVGLNSSAKGELLKQNSEESDVSTLWQKRWCVDSGKDKGDNGWIPEIKEQQIVIFERLAIQIFSMYPLLSMKVLSSLEQAKHLISKLQKL